jgi:antitoxin component YwqK of YwqJK toxin-antitoxin module
MYSCQNKQANTSRKQTHETTNITPNNKTINLKKLQPYLIDTYKGGEPKKMKYFDIINGEKVFKYYREFYPGKKIKVEGPLKNNKRQGHWVYYYENGVKWSEGNYIDGKAVGKFTIRYDDGLLWIHSYFNNGIKTKEIIYNKNGQIIQEKNYQ